MTSKIKSVSIVALLLLSALVSVSLVAAGSNQNSVAPATVKPYAPLPGTLTLSATSGPVGTIVTLTGSGYTAKTTYSVWLDTTSGTPLYLVGYFVPTSAGAIQSNSTFNEVVTIPGQASAGSDYIEAFAGANLTASTSFSVTATTATLALSVTSGAPGTNKTAGTQVTLTGSGYTPNQYYEVFVDTKSGTPIYANFAAEFLATSTGAIPANTYLYVPAVAAGSYYIETYYWAWSSNQPLISSAAFTVT